MAPINFSIMNANTKLYQCEKRKNHREKKRWSFVRFSRELEGEIRVVERPSVHLDSPHHPNTSSASQCAVQHLPSSPINSHIHTLMTEVGCHAMCRPPRQRRQCPIFNAQPLMQPLKHRWSRNQEVSRGHAARAGAPNTDPLIRAPSWITAAPNKNIRKQVGWSSKISDCHVQKAKKETTTKQPRKI